jgi:hypothetical protein
MGNYGKLGNRDNISVIGYISSFLIIGNNGNLFKILAVQSLLVFLKLTIKLFLINIGIFHDDNIHPKTFANPRY